MHQEVLDLPNQVQSRLAAQRGEEVLTLVDGHLPAKARTGDAGAIGHHEGQVVRQAVQQRVAVTRVARQVRGGRPRPAEPNPGIIADEPAHQLRGDQLEPWLDPAAQLSQRSRQPSHRRPGLTQHRHDHGQSARLGLVQPPGVFGGYGLGELPAWVSQPPRLRREGNQRITDSACGHRAHAVDLGKPDRCRRRRHHRRTLLAPGGG